MEGGRPVEAFGGRPPRAPLGPEHLCDAAQRDAAVDAVAERAAVRIVRSARALSAGRALRAEMMVATPWQPLCPAVAFLVSVLLPGRCPVVSSCTKQRRVLLCAGVDQGMAAARDYINDLSADGRYHFTTEEAVSALGGSTVAVRAALRRASQRGEVASPQRGFYVIVPPEYRRLGCLPPEQFIPHLMNRLGQPYYVALLSAAELHGAAHHRPQRFQVMVRTNRRLIECGKVRVQFVARHDLERMPLVERNTPRGTVLVSSPEATALDLVGYAGRCGGLDNVASVLSDLVESLNSQRLLEVARLCPVVWSQRLGYLLELASHDDLASVLADYVGEAAATLAPLVRARAMRGAPRTERWKLAINASVEFDL